MLFTHDEPTRETSRFNRDKLPDGSGICLMTREQRACYAVGICLMAMKGKGPAVIRKILKWICIVLGSLVGLLVLVFAILYMIGGARWNRIRWNYDFPFDS